MTRPRSSLGPSDAKMDAALIRNLQRLCAERGKELTTTAARIAELEAEVARLREALTPFARVAVRAEESLKATGMSENASPGWGVKAKHLFAARAALAAPDTGGADGE